MTTNTTNSPDIHDLLCDLFEAGFDSPGRHESTADYRKARDAILSHIKAEVAQVQSNADLRYKELAELHERTLDKLQESESRLAEIQRGVEGLTRWDLYVEQGGYDIWLAEHETGEFIKRDEVIALFSPQGQASNTSGLPE